MNSDEVTELNRIVSIWLDFAEDQASRRKQVFMQDWQSRLDDFLHFNERAVLNDTGRVSKKPADEKARAEFEQFAEKRRHAKEAEGEVDWIRQLEAMSKRGKS